MLRNFDNKSSSFVAFGLFENQFSSFLVNNDHKNVRAFIDFMFLETSNITTVIIVTLRKKNNGEKLDFCYQTCFSLDSNNKNK